MRRALFRRLHCILIHINLTFVKVIVYFVCACATALPTLAQDKWRDYIVYRPVVELKSAPDLANMYAIKKDYSAVHAGVDVLMPLDDCSTEYLQCLNDLGSIISVPECDVDMKHDWSVEGTDFSVENEVRIRLFNFDVDGILIRINDGKKPVYYMYYSRDLGVIGFRMAGDRFGNQLYSLQSEAGIFAC